VLNLGNESIGIRTLQTQRFHAFEFGVPDEFVELLHFGVLFQIGELKAHRERRGETLLDPEQALHRGSRHVEKGVLAIIQLTVSIAGVILDPVVFA